VALSHINLETVFRYNFSLIQHHKWNLSDIESLLPWERDIYIEMLIQHIKEQEEKQKEQQRKRG
tara:strand:- start:1329 stop:1520 length:192 start_codon:yes stop_codon:yes gene_type:complete